MDLNLEEFLLLILMVNINIYVDVLKKIKFVKYMSICI